MIRVTRSAIIDAPIDEVWPILRDFNSHWAWHPAVGPSYIENGEPPDQIGCVRNFELKDGNHIREQLLALSDDDHISTYCILDATLPMRRYVATLQLKPVTDGHRTFWHWQSSFEVPRGREREFEDLVGKGVYEGGFEGLRAYLRRHRGRPWVAQITSAGRAGSGALPAVGAGPVKTTSTTAKAIVVSQFGGPEVLSYRDVQIPAPGPGEVQLRQSAIGVNYIDIYVRKGQYRMIEPPQTLGMEAAGTVLAVGAGVAHLLPGDRVAYACPPVGSYTTVRTLPADQVVALPDDVSDEAGACLMLKGLTVEYLLHRTCQVRRGDVVLVHAAAGGVGLLLCQWASAIGARVIGTVSTEDKARLARANGCAHPIVTRNYRFADAVRAASNGAGARYIFDGLGREAVEENFDAIALCGHWISYGQASGPSDAMALERLSQKSLTLSRPVLFHYTAQRRQLEEMAANTFEAYRSGRIRLDIRHRYPLANAAEAHRALEARQTTGPMLLIP